MRVTVALLHVVPETLGLLIVGSNKLSVVHPLILLSFLILIAFLKATFTKPSPGMLQVSLSGALRTKVDSGGADIMVALYESGVITDCEKGENKGQVLANHYVVRRMEKMSTVKDVSAKKSLSGNVQFALWDGFNSAKCGLLLFVQNGALQAFGSQHFKIPDTV